MTCCPTTRCCRKNHFQTSHWSRSPMNRSLRSHCLRTHSRTSHSRKNLRPTIRWNRCPTNRSLKTRTTRCQTNRCRCHRPDLDHWNRHPSHRCCHSARCWRRRCHHGRGPGRALGHCRWSHCCWHRRPGCRRWRRPACRWSACPRMGWRPCFDRHRPGAPRFGTPDGLRSPAAERPHAHAPAPAGSPARHRVAPPPPGGCRPG